MDGRGAFRPAGRAIVITVLGIVLVAAGLAGPAEAGRYRAARPDIDVVLEGGVSQPHGELGETYAEYLDERGLGAEMGYGVGARLRAHWPSGWTISPSFRFEDFGDFAGLRDDDPVTVKTSILRYGVDAQYFLPVREGSLQPFFSGGVALFHNRYRDEIDTVSDPSFYEASVNALGFGVGGGVCFQGLEVSATYNFNRFETTRLPFDFGVRSDYNWDYLSVSFGFALPLDPPRR
jgi:hypothetical protein